MKRVTENKGRKTAGIDGKVWTTLGQKIRAVERIAIWNGYHPKALKRIYINRKKLIKMTSVSHYIGKISKQQNGHCPQCGQLIQGEEKHHLHYIDDDRDFDVYRLKGKRSFTTYIKRNYSAYLYFASD